MNFTHRAISIGFAVIVFRVSIFAYAPLGHQIVGGIADERLANTSTAAKVHALLDGLTLEKSALIPDEIKGWDKTAWTIRGLSITRPVAPSTDNCVISGGQINQRSRIRASRCQVALASSQSGSARMPMPPPRLRTTGFTTPTFRWFRPRPIARASPVAANGTSCT